MKDPTFSIVMPLYNRAGQIGRAVESCLCQEGDDFEIVVVDDASTDNSVEVVQALGDDRIRLLRHDVNRGVGPARNTGIAAARGQWIVLLDSDHALLPGALDRMRSDVADLHRQVGQINYNCVYENGDPCPDPPLRTEIWGYRAFLGYAERHQTHSDVQTATRRTTFNHIRFPENRMLESGYHLDFARRYKIYTRPEVVKRIYRDSGNRISTRKGKALLLNATDQAMGLRDLLRRHGKALRTWAPSKYENFVGACCTNAFLAGKRTLGFRMAVHSIAKRPMGLRMWMILLLGMLGPHPLLAGIQLREEIRSIRRKVRRGI